MALFFHSFHVTNPNIMKINQFYIPILCVFFLHYRHAKRIM